MNKRRNNESNLKQQYKMLTLGSGTECYICIISIFSTRRQAFLFAPLVIQESSCTAQAKPHPKEQWQSPHPHSQCRMAPRGCRHGCSRSLGPGGVDSPQILLAIPTSAKPLKCARGSPLLKLREGPEDIAKSWVPSLGEEARLSPCTATYNTPAPMASPDHSQVHAQGQVHGRVLRPPDSVDGSLLFPGWKTYPVENT